MIANFFRSIDRTIEYTLFLIFLAFTLVGGLQVFNRFVFGLPLSWSEEFQKFGHIWMVMLAIPVAYRRGAHLGMDTLLRKFPGQFQRAIGLLTEVLWLALALAVFGAGANDFSALDEDGLALSLSILGGLMASGLAFVVMARWFWRRLQGFTGDCLGATQQMCELAFYLGLALAL